MAVSRQEAREEARRLVVSEGFSYADAATMTGIPLSTLQKYGADEGWQRQRESAMSYGHQVRAMKAHLMERIGNLAKTEGADQAIAQLIHAWRAMEAAYPEHRYAERREDPQLRLTVSLEVLEEVVGYLADNDTNVLAALQPHIRTIAQRLEAKYAAA